MKLVLLVIDGMGDRPSSKLNGKTCLEYAEIPNLNSLAKSGRTGLMYTVKKGIAPESHTGVISVLGYDPFKYTASRGVFEAVGAGMKFKDGDLALRCNFVTLGEGMNIVDRRAGRDLTSQESGQLGEEINKNVRLESYAAGFEFRSTVSYRGALVIRSKGIRLSDNITDTDPAYYRDKNIAMAKAEFQMIAQESRPLDSSEAAKASASLVNEFSRKVRGVLEVSKVNRGRARTGRLKANYLLTRDAGIELPGFVGINQGYGVHFASLVNMPVEKGIAKLTGMEAIEIPIPSIDQAGDCELAVDKLKEYFKAYDCFYVHIKGPDEPGHDGDCIKKAQLLEVVDKHFFGRLKENIDSEDLLICVTADHATPCVAKVHTDDPVPFLISSSRLAPDGSEGFSERICAKGSLGTLRKGTELMPKLMALLRELNGNRT